MEKKLNYIFRDCKILPQNIVKENGGIDNNVYRFTYDNKEYILKHYSDIIQYKNESLFLELYGGENGGITVPKLISKNEENKLVIMEYILFLLIR